MDNLKTADYLIVLN